MLSLEFPKLDRPLRLLCLGAHCDDIEIGCGGTLLQWIAAGVRLDVHWAVFASDPRREAEARASAALFLTGAESINVEIHSYADGFLPDRWSEIKADFESIKRQVSPDIVLTHHHQDLHQDHRVVSELTWNTFRNHLILEFEILKYDPDIGNPNVFVLLEESIARRKAEQIWQAFPTQREKSWFSRDSFLSLMRVRGAQMGYGGHAEGFYARKLSIGENADPRNGTVRATEPR